MRRRFGAGLAVTLLAGLPAAMAAQLQPSDLTYLGAFVTPTTTTFQDWGSFLQTYRGSQMSYRADGDSGAGTLLMSFGTRLVELRLSNLTPRLSSLQTATVLQSTTDITAGSLSALLQNDSTGGVKLVSARGNQATEKLYFGSYEYYNTDVTDYNSLGFANLNFSSPAAQGIWHVGPTTSDNGAWSIGPKHGEYVIPVPHDWATTNLGGRSILVGRSRESAGAGGSAGPVLTAVAPISTSSPPAAGTALAATPLMSFDTGVAVYLSGTGWQKWRMGGDPDWDYYSIMDRVKDGEWIASGDKRALVLVKRHGTFDNDPSPCVNSSGNSGYNGGFCIDAQGRTPPWCYGEAYTTCSQAGPASSSYGFHAGPYKGRLVFIDPDDLADVYAGTIGYDEVDGYAVYDLMDDWGTPSGTVEDRTGGNDPCGIAYDSTNRRLYVCQSNGNDPNGHPNPAWPVIHVYEVAAGTGDTTAPTVTTRTIGTTGQTLTLAMSEAVTATGTAPTLTSCSGGATTLTYSSGSGSASLAYTISRQVLAAETGCVNSYTQPGNGIEDTTGNDLASYSNQGVTNSSTATLVALSGLTPSTGTRLRRTVTQTTIGVTTDKAASCRWGPIPGLAWADLTAYTTTGSTAHSSALAVTPGTVYQICARCLDTLANQYSADACAAWDVRPERRLH
jgi:hypothetical protein